MSRKYNRPELSFLGPRQTTRARNPKLLAPGPGPGAYRDMKNMGEMSTTNKAVSQFSTSGSCGFGSSTRDQGTYSMYKATPSQGAIYKIEGSLGKQVRSNRRSASKMDFGTSTRGAFMKTYGIWSDKLN
jgi:hypothetical protein